MKKISVLKICEILLVLAFFSFVLSVYYLQDNEITDIYLSNTNYWYFVLGTISFAFVYYSFIYRGASKYLLNLKYGFLAVLSLLFSIVLASCVYSFTVFSNPHYELGVVILIISVLFSHSFIYLNRSIRTHECAGFASRALVFVFLVKFSREIAQLVQLVWFYNYLFWTVLKTE